MSAAFWFITGWLSASTFLLIVLYIGWRLGERAMDTEAPQNFADTGDFLAANDKALAQFDPRAGRGMP